ncbi:MAG TPA: GNAT family N-acetyltransferase, partial [Pyrinomonadaceae bacterium]
MFLRFPNSVDFAEFTALNKSSRKFHRNLVNPPTDEKSFADFLNRSELETDCCFLICHREDGAIVGGAALSQIFRKAFQNAYLGYYLAEKYTG